MQDDFLDESSNQHSSLLTCAFNQDGGCLAIGTTSGFSVHNLHPHYAVSVDRRLQGGIGSVEMLFRCNLMVLVGGGPSPQAPPHKVLIHDDHVGKPIGELSFRQVVLQAKLRKDAIAVALRDRVYVYNLADLSLRDKIYTADNPHGLLCLSTQISDMVLACPSVTPGHVRVELYGLRKTVLMEAHEGSLRGIALTADGTKLATASDKGTVVRVWDVTTGSCLQEFRRGVERATITCLAWSWDHTWLCCTSQKGTLHIFQCQDTAASSNNTNNHHQHHGSGNSSSSTQTKQPEEASTSLTQMLFSTVRKQVEGDAKKSVCQIRGVPHPMACAFVASAPNLVAVAGWDADGNGVLLLSEFVAGQEPKRVGYHVLCKTAVIDESEESRRRRRLRGWTPQIPQTPEGGRLYVGERLEVLEQGMEQIQFDEGLDDDEFVSVSTVPPPTSAPAKADKDPVASHKTNSTSAISDETKAPESPNNSSSEGTDGAAGSNIGDSMRTESLDDDDDVEPTAPSSPEITSSSS